MFGAGGVFSRHRCVKLCNEKRWQYNLCWLPYIIEFLICGLTCLPEVIGYSLTLSVVTSTVYLFDISVTVHHIEAIYEKKIIVKLFASSWYIFLTYSLPSFGSKWVCVRRIVMCWHRK